MRLLPTIKDSADRESHTLLFIAMACIPLVARFTFGGITLPFIGTLPIMSASEFGMAFAAIMAVWLGREWIKQ